MTNRVIDQYTVELETLSEDENKPLPVRCIATNTDDESSAEVWLTRDRSRDLLNYMYGNEPSIVDHWMQQLEDHHYADLISQIGVSGTPVRCVLGSQQLLQFGFSRDELRPWRREPESIDAR